MWQKLSDAEWRDHELNKFRGWLSVVIILNCLVLVVTEIDLWLLVVLSDSDLGVAVPGRPIAADAFVLTVDMLGTAVCLYAIWTRQFRAPEIYLAATLLVALVGIGVIWSDPEFSFPLYVIAYAIVVALFVVAPVLYLFLGARPNVIFKRRVRAAA